MEYAGEDKLQMFFCTLITGMCACFMMDVGISQPEAGPVIEGIVVPRVASYASLQAVGIIGAVIMPHNIYLHSGLVNADETRPVNRHSKTEVSEANKYNAIESTIALAFSFIINAFVVTSFAAAFYSHQCAEQSQGNMACIPYDAVLQGEDMWPALNSTLPSGRWFNPSGVEWPAPHDITNYGNDYCNSHDSTTTGKSIHPWVCSNIGLQNAGLALKDTFPGTAATVMWGVGLLAAGQMSTVTGTRAGQYVMEGFVNIKIPKWKRVLVTRSVALVPAVAFALLSADNPSIGDTMNQWLNILQSVQLPFALLPVLHFTSRRNIMGPFKNSVALQALCWALAFLVITVNFFLIYETLKDADLAFYQLALVYCLGFAYVTFIAIIIREDAKRFYIWVQVQLGNELDDSILDSPVAGGAKGAHEALLSPEEQDLANSRWQ